MAGDHAQSIYANSEAEQFFERALEAARHLQSIERDDGTKLLVSLGDVRMRAWVTSPRLKLLTGSRSARSTRVPSRRQA